MAAFVWTDQAIKELKSLWATGITASQAAHEITIKFGYGVSRSAVLGKIKRLGFVREKHNHKNAHPPQRTKRMQRLQNERETTPAPSAGPVVDRADNPTKLFDLRPGMCRWPFGNPREEGFHFCGGHALWEKPYCGRHWLASINRSVLKNKAEN